MDYTWRFILFVPVIQHKHIHGFYVLSSSQKYIKCSGLSLTFSIALPTVFAPNSTHHLGDQLVRSGKSLLAMDNCGATFLSSER